MNVKCRYKYIQTVAGMTNLDTITESCIKHVCITNN